MNFFKRTKTSQMEDASALQLALLEEAERNIYGDSTIYDSQISAPPVYDSLLGFDHEKQQTSDPSGDFSRFNSTLTTNTYGTGKSLFPLLDQCLYMFPMWITRDRKYYCLNFFGLFVTYIFQTVYCFDAVTGGHYSGLDADNLEAIGSAYKFIVAGNAVWIPVQIICQLRFHKKYFKIFWTDDKRDNRMIYFIAENNRYKKIYLAMFVYLFIKIGLAAIYTYSAFSYTRDYVYSDFIFPSTWGFIMWQVIKFVFFYIPRSLHGIVIFLYCLEWKFRVKYFWKCKFIEYLHENSLLKHYKKMQQFMEYQLFWIKGWMQADFLAVCIAIWYWVWVWFQYRKIDTETELSDLIIEGLGYIFYHSMGFVLTWLTGASITAEAEDLLKCATRILEKLNEQHFKNCFDNSEENVKMLVDYHQLDNEPNDKDITGYKESRMKYRRKGSMSQSSKYGRGKVDQMDFEESWKSLMSNKDIIWEEWIYNNNCDVNDIRDEMKRSCLIKQLQMFILYYNKHPCVFKIGIVLRYSTMFKIVIVFTAAKLVDYLWGFTAIS